MPDLHRSDWPDVINHVPHAYQTSRRCLQAIFDHNRTERVTHSGERSPHASKTSQGHSSRNLQLHYRRSDDAPW